MEVVKFLNWNFLVTLNIMASDSYVSIWLWRKAIDEYKFLSEFISEYLIKYS